MAKEWSEEEIRAMIVDSRKIVEEDRERSHYNMLHEKYGVKPDDDGKKPPPAKDPKKDDPPKKPLWGAYADE